VSQTKNIKKNLGKTFCPLKKETTIMPKVATEYYSHHEWNVREEGFDITRNQVSESIFSLGNEYMGVRGYAEEGISAPTLQGSYFNGIYEYAKEKEGFHYKGIVDRTHFMVNSVNWLKAKIVVGGEILDTAKCKISNYVRELDFRNGLLTREFILETNKGKVKLKFSRFISMNKCERGYSKIELESIDFDGDVEMELSLDFNVLHWGKDCYWQKGVTEKKDGAVAIECLTLSGAQRVASAMKIVSPHKGKVFESAQEIGEKFVFKMKKGEKTDFVRYVTNIAEKKTSRSLIMPTALSAVIEQAKEGFEVALECNKTFYDKVWCESDIEIKGDIKNQQGIRYCIFQLVQTYHGLDPHNNIGAKGLTGEAYSGHAFWDTETYCLPFYLLGNLEAAKNLLLFRYNTLDQARQRAKQLDCVGACYPIATLNGFEACTLWQHASLQFQPSTGVAYGVFHYMNISNDTDFLFDYGVEMLVEVSRFLFSRGDFNADRSKFGFYAVMGPDEFQMMVNHNAYTNYMAKRTFDYTLEVLAELEKKDSKRLKTVLDKVKFDPKEKENYLEASKKTYIPENKKTKVIEQHEGFFDLPHIDIQKIPPTDFPLYYNWSYDRIYRNDMIKQPDVLMFMLLYPDDFNIDVLRANYEYYEPRTIHESSLSPSVHSIFAAELGKLKEAEKFFSFATRMDLDDYNRNTNEGLHTTSIAAAWLNIVYGFGGLRTDGKMLKLNPVLPPSWSGYSFKFNYHGTVAKVTVDKSGAKIEKISGNGFEFLLAGKKTKI